MSVITPSWRKNKMMELRCWRETPAPAVWARSHGRIRPSLMPEMPTAQAEPKAWVMFFLSACVNVFFRTSSIIFSGTVVQREHWKPEGDFSSKLSLNWDCPCGTAPGLSQELTSLRRPSPACPETCVNSELHCRSHQQVLWWWSLVPPAEQIVQHL